MKLSFYGAAEQVTGSCYLLEFKNGYKILIDCGLEFENGHKNEKKTIKEIIPFEASEVNAVILTHAHLDHSGKIPLLFNEGFEGSVYSSLPTYYLSYLLLMDSANLNERKLNALFAGKKKHTKNKPEKRADGLYLQHHVKEAMAHFQSVAFHQKIKLTDGVSFTLLQAGHLLGAASILVEYEEDKELKSILFSGDLGRVNYPLLPNVDVSPTVDYLVCESTYGNREHKDDKNAVDLIHDVVKNACVDKAGRLLIPAFSIGRAQTILHILYELTLQNKLPKIKIFLDSPLAVESSKAYSKMRKFLNKDASEFIDDNGDLFDWDNVSIIKTNEQSKNLVNHFEPCIILSSSGMLDGGRIQNHIANNLANAYATILMIGYSAKGTLGHKIANGLKSVHINQKEVNINAEIVQTDIFSGHADQSELLGFVNYQSKEKLKSIFLVHGEKESMLTFQNLLQKEGFNSIEIPKFESTYEL